MLRIIKVWMRTSLLAKVLERCPREAKWLNNPVFDLQFQPYWFSFWTNLFKLTQTDYCGCNVTFAHDGTLHTLLPVQHKQWEIICNLIISHFAESLNKLRHHYRSVWFEMLQCRHGAIWIGCDLHVNVESGGQVYTGCRRWQVQTSRCAAAAAAAVIKKKKLLLGAVRIRTFGFQPSEILPSWLVLKPSTAAATSSTVPLSVG